MLIFCPLISISECVMMYIWYNNEYCLLITHKLIVEFIIFFCKPILNFWLWKTWISELLLLYNCPSNTFITLKNILLWLDIWSLSFAIKCYAYIFLSSEFFQNYCISRRLVCKKLISMLFSCPKKKNLGYIMWYSFF